MKNAFYFILKAPFVIEIFKFLSTAWLEKLYAQPEDHSKKGTLSKSIKLSEHKKTDRYYKFGTEGMQKYFKEKDWRF